MNGAESLVRTLVASGVEVCFANPGTSEMHFVAALDRVPGMRCVLGLFEGVVTGAADGYWRMADKPAATLLHLGPGLGNGLANLHNAKKGRAGIVNIVGEHATYHLAHDAPLTSDIAGVAGPMSNWVCTARDARTIATDAARAVQIARRPPGNIATLIAPADTAWNESNGAVAPLPVEARKPVAAPAVDAVAKLLRRGEPTALILGNIATRERALAKLGRIAARTGCALVGEYNVPRTRRGAGTVRIERVPYAVDPALAMLSRFRHVVLVGAKVPVAFFAYPDKPSVLIAEGTSVTTLAGVEDDIEGALDALVEALDAGNAGPGPVANEPPPALPTGSITLEKLGAAFGALIPDEAIIVDEAVSSGRGFAPFTVNARPHDWLNVMGGAIGFGLPCGAGAAIGAPDRKVIVLEGDGSGMYTVQALWTMARENLNVLVVVFANRAYRILQGELKGVGVTDPGRRALDMLGIDRPDLDWVALARGHGVEAGRATDLDELAREVRRGLAVRGPYLVELVM